MGVNQRFPLSSRRFWVELFGGCSRQLECANGDVYDWSVYDSFLFSKIDGYEVPERRST